MYNVCVTEGPGAGVSGTMIDHCYSERLSVVAKPAEGRHLHMVHLPPRLHKVTIGRVRALETLRGGT